MPDPKLTKKFVTDEYHEGQTAYNNGMAITTNPYMQNPESKGAMWYWMFGWQDGLADDVRNIKTTIMAAAVPTDPRGMN